MRELVGKPVNSRREDGDTGTMMIVEVASRALAEEIMDGKRTLQSAGPLRLIYARRTGVYTDYLMAWSDKATATYDKGATGFGVRLLDQYIADTVEG